MERVREFTFTDRDFNLIRELVGQHAGISLADSKRDLVYSRLTRRLRKLGLKSFEDYCQLLKAGNKDEMVEFINAITTNLTSFFRETHHFDYLGGTLLPALIKQKERFGGIRIWSAGCSTGEEPYSLAIVAKEAMQQSGPADIKILATDIDSNVLETAKAGIYSEDKIKGMNPDRVRKWFVKGKGAQEGYVKVHADLQGLISFKQLNLMEPWPMRNSFDIIFCRNVVIYFTKETQKMLFNRFADNLDKNGHLFVGHSETLFKVCDRFDSLGKTIYRRIR